MNQDQLEQLDILIEQIHKRGNDVEIRNCKDGLKVIEVHRKVIVII